MIDLHSHTTASDGQHPPHEQVSMAAKAGVKVLSVTDHDTVAGLEDAATACRQHGIELVPGIEVSCTLQRREIHVLGHFVDPMNSELRAYATRLVDEREHRMARMVERLASQGIPVTLSQVQEIAGDAPLTRPHLARVLVELRLCTSVKEAFSRFLGDGKLAWVPKFEMSVEAGIALIHAAGGTATVAHPASSRVNRYELDGMAKAGLDGIETVHRDHPPSQRELFEKWARELSLCCTAGSDFHGAKIAPDRMFGSVTMSPTEFQRLRERRA